VEERPSATTVISPRITDFAVELYKQFSRKLMREQVL
jgi:hypothetical protein